ncbi:hypothetical protein Thiofri_00561 [Thiorhodovibrio frisius]|nr:hypothetical protein Thiofri_00561 [Thiorhodovibrio frisius]
MHQGKNPATTFRKYPRNPIGFIPCAFGTIRLMVPATSSMQAAVSQKEDSHPYSATPDEGDSAERARLSGRVVDINKPMLKAKTLAQMLAEGTNTPALGGMMADGKIVHPELARLMRGRLRNLAA